jgi:hypothetical protein
MAADEDIISRRYRETYASLHRQLLERRQTDPEFSIQDLRGFLKDVYAYQENDWVGRGALFDATQSATVAAHEAVLAEWQAELE